jgi:hypothetical protein
MFDSKTLQDIEETRLNHPFLTFLLVDTEIHVGVIQNETPKIVMFYDFGKIVNEEDKKRFMKYADEWWWGRNQSVPVDSFIGNRFDRFKMILVGYPKKLIQSTIGPTFSLQEKYLKRVKKKKIDIISRKKVVAA